MPVPTTAIRMDMKDLLRLLCLALSFVSIIGVDVSTYPCFWPLPRSFSNGSVSLSVIPAMLEFNTSSKSAILRKSWTRAQSTMFAWAGKGASTHSKPFKLEGSTLTSVFVEVASDDENLQLGMNESYTLDVSQTAGQTHQWSVSITANSIWGAMHALTTLTQMVTRLGEGTPSANNSFYELRNAPWHIVDEPVLPHRGLMIDSSRHFLSVESILRQIQALAMNKYNPFSPNLVLARCDANPRPQTTG